MIMDLHPFIIYSVSLTISLVIVYIIMKFTRKYDFSKNGLKVYFKIVGLSFFGSTILYILSLFVLFAVSPFIEIVKDNIFNFMLYFAIYTIGVIWGGLSLSKYYNV